MKKKIFSCFTFCLILTSLFMPLVTLIPASAQEVTTDIAQDVLASDTATSVYDTVSFEIVDAELPSEQIIVDESTIYSDNLYDISEYFDEIYLQDGHVYDYVPNENFRDMTTYVSAYLSNTNPESIEVIAPINVRPELLDMFSVDQLIAMLYYDIDFKNQQRYKMLLTDDLFEAYDLSLVYTPEMMADVKASVMRAEDLMTYVEADEEDYSYTAALDWLEQMYEDYEIFEKRYNSAVLASPEIDYIYSDEAVQTEETEESMASLQEAMIPIPDHLKQRMHTIGIVSAYELPPSWDYSSIDAFATYNMEMFFSDQIVASSGLIYHELGHVVDFATLISEDVISEEYYSLSHSPEWEAIHSVEWAEEGSYYDTLIESFAQAFGSYAVEYYEGITMEEVGYVDYGLEGRPESRAFMEELFINLDL